MRTEFAMGEADFNERKARFHERHLRGAKRAQKRKDNLEKKRRRLGLAPTNEPPAELTSGAREAPHRVARVARTEIEVLSPGGNTSTAKLSRRAIDGGGVVVGDEVWFDERGLIGGHLERRTLLERRAPGRQRKTKLLAANVDKGLVVLAPRESGLALGFLDRAAAALRGGGIEPVVVVTKIDLIESERARDVVLGDLTAWRRGGGPVFAVDSLSGEGVDGLREAIRSSVSVLVGHSGVGKSTLVNALDPGAGQRTGAVRERDGRGRQTTTESRLVPFLGSGALVDTPGVRLLVPDVRDPLALLESIPELTAYVGTCAFGDCTHGGERGCAISEAAETNAEVAAGLARWRRLVDSVMDEREAR